MYESDWGGGWGCDTVEIIRLNYAYVSHKILKDKGQERRKETIKKEKEREKERH